MARILNADGVPEGAGFRASRREVITCAHVVAKALGLPGDTVEPPDGRLWVDFPLAERGARVPARIAAWTPVSPDGSGDVAVLTLLADPPGRATIARLVEDTADPDRRVRAFGFPDGYDDGTWSVGWLRGETGAGWLQYDTDPASEHRVQGGFSGCPVWDVAEGGVVGMVVAAERRDDVRTAYVIPTRTLRGTWSRLADAALPACPFRALEPFEERDAALFHGRAEPARRIADLLGYAPAANLVGPSGCGKSSLLHAGVLPLLRRRTELEIVVFRPGRLGRTPLDALALALLPLLEPDLTETARISELPALTALLRDGRFPDVAERLLARRGTQRLLVVADQFEEALIGTEPAELDALATALAYSLNPGSRLQVVTTLRADFLTPALAHPGLAPLFAGDRLFTVGAMSDAELRDAVQLPLAGTGVMYEPGLVDRILGDLGSDPGRLPLLEFTLTKLWERQRRGRIGHAAYESLGRVHEALVTHAEQVWTGALTETEQDAARALLVQLIHPGDTGTAPTRRTLARSELNPEQWRLAQRLMTTRLVVPGEDYRPDGGPPEETVELAHETLLTHWDRLRTYFEKDRDFRTWQEGLRRRIAQWSADDRRGRRLLRGQDLRDALRWRSLRSAELRPAEAAFVEASAKSARRRWFTTAAVTVVLALVGGLGTWAWGQDIRRESAGRASEILVQQSIDADTGRIGADMGQSYTSLLLALRAYRTRDTELTRARLGEMYARYGFADLLAPHYPAAILLPTEMTPTTASVVDADATVAAVRTAEGKLLVLRRDAKGIHRFPTGEQADVTAISPDGTMVALAGSFVPTPGDMAAGKTATPDLQKLPARILDVETGRTRQLETPPGTEPPPRIGGDEILPGVPVPELQLPDVPGFTMPTQYARFAFSPDSKVLLGQTGIGGENGRLVLWDTESGRIKKVMPGLPEGVEQLWLSDGGAHLLTVAHHLDSVWDSKITMTSWDLTGSTPVPRELLSRPSTLSKNLYTDVSQDLSRVALVEVTSEGATIRQRIELRDLADGKLLREEGNERQVVVQGVTAGAEASQVVAYAVHTTESPGQPVTEGPVRTITGRESWAAMDLTGPAARQAVVLKSLGVLAVVFPGPRGPPAPDPRTPPPPGRAPGPRAGDGAAGVV
ncbi:trypsin-like peptidase domain-containing protein, partial [Streptomyces sp. NPDC056387]|uniref:nSTAND1 domain-containing NTPase n=1 Tax=Streptomyces sp. NPDC056387 TaxID=3345803 RepID=UPI0035E17347